MHEAGDDGSAGPKRGDDTFLGAQGGRVGIRALVAFQPTPIIARMPDWVTETKAEGAESSLRTVRIDPSRVQDTVGLHAPAAIRRVLPRASQPDMITRTTSAATTPAAAPSMTFPALPPPVKASPLATMRRKRIVGKAPSRPPTMGIAVQTVATNARKTRESTASHALPT